MDNKQYSIINLPKICDPRGNLTVAESMRHVPFDVSRVYWTYDVPDMPTSTAARLLLPSAARSQ